MENNNAKEYDDNLVKKYHLFEVIGVELEYMVVKEDTLDVYPVVDKLLGNFESGEIRERAIPGSPAVWSNELASHVLEFKVGRPVESLDGLSRLFHEQVLLANRELSRIGGILLPGAVHPWMNPKKDFHVWQHGDRAIYETFNRIFDCRSHGWANLQSTHLNFPFHGDDEFKKLHTALRLLIPIIPALCASSPYIDGKYSGYMDVRMEVYRNNSSIIPAIAGLVVPDPAVSEGEYIRMILNPIADAIAPYDSEKVLESIWVNSRGCIARFDRGSIELRIMDIQECPQADIALAYLVKGALKLLVEEILCDTEYQINFKTESLHRIMLDCNREAENAKIGNEHYLAAFGVGKKCCRAGDIWSEIASRVIYSNNSFYGSIDTAITGGTLARRLFSRLGANPHKKDIIKTYRILADCLVNNCQFSASYK